MVVRGRGSCGRPWVAGERPRVRLGRALTLQSPNGYAGGQTKTPDAGIRATIGTVSPPKVVNGHVAGWVGVGGPNAGPKGRAEWRQAGYAAFDTGQAQVYYEVTVPGETPAYHTVKATLRSGERHLVGVLEVSKQSGGWRVWFDGRAVSPVLSLPGSHGKLVPQAIGETRNGSHR
jgi:hypothetical protein